MLVMYWNGLVIAMLRQVTTLTNIDQCFDHHFTAQVFSTWELPGNFVGETLRSIRINRNAIREESGFFMHKRIRVANRFANAGVDTSYHGNPPWPQGNIDKLCIDGYQESLGAVASVTVADTGISRVQRV